MCLLPICSGVSIDNVMVPPVVEEGENYVILDCPFTFNYDEEEYLELKWYFNDSPSPFYQWIPGSDDGTPQVIGDMWKDNMDLNYTKYDDRNSSFHNYLSLTETKYFEYYISSCNILSA